MSPRSLAAASIVSLLCSCDAVVDDAPAARREARAERASQSRDVPSRTAHRQIVAFGDSLTAGYGIGLDEAYPAALQDILDEKGYPYEVVNAGVSGETSAGGVRRLDWVLEDRDVAVLILALGANDGLRGLPPSEMKKNLAAIIEETKSRGIQVLLAGFTPPDEAKDQYLREFIAVYPALAEEHEVAFMPFFLEDVAGVRELNQPDGKHPNPAGARRLAANVWEHLEPLLSRDHGVAAP